MNTKILRDDVSWSVEVYDKGIWWKHIIDPQEEGARRDYEALCATHPGQQWRLCVERTIKTSRIVEPHDDPATQPHQYSQEDIERLVGIVAYYMRLKLSENMHKAAWLSLTDDYLRRRLLEELTEQDLALTVQQSNDEVWKEAADIAAFAAFRADRYAQGRRLRIPDGTPFVRDINSPCEYYEPGETIPTAECHGDGHYLCQGCKNFQPQTEE